MSRALYDACKCGDYERVSVLLKDPNIDINEQYLGYTPLYTASVSNHINIVELLLDHDADIDKTDWTSVTPLFIAVTNGNVALASLLLQRGADIKFQTCAGRTVEKVGEQQSQGMKDLIQFYSETPIKVPNED